ncbi:hypothetical protein GCM10022255_005100 [Dactylosporangium darangshiense]|uniref:Uncharacterized protein n=1 Tax=Dactylosporangium darangshiense TaxID=579108 RepID=A0ABP8CVK8_9ACTN
MRLEDLDDVGDRVLGQQHAAKDALLGGDVLGWGALESFSAARRALGPLASLAAAALLGRGRIVPRI